MKALLLALVTSLAALPAPAAEVPPGLLAPGQGWELVGEGYGFTDAACADAQGNFYFSDLPKGVLHRVDPAGKVTPFLENGPKISGLKVGADGRFYAATQGPKKQIITITPDTKAITVLLDDTQPNDLVVTKAGRVYFTHTGKGQVIAVDASGQATVAATGLNAPNGITLSPDQRTLAVSEYRGTNVWTFAVKEDGTLGAGQRTMTLRVPAGRPDSGGDGSATDAAGRRLVTSHLGVQVFDAAGRWLGLIEKPSAKACVSVAVAGAKGEFLYVCASDKVFRRRLAP